MEEEKATGKGNTYEFNAKDFIGSFIGVLKTVLVKPSDFYQNMPTIGGYPPPLTFLSVCLGISGIFAIIITGGDVLMFFKVVIAGVIFSFIGAAILHLVAQQFFEGKGSYEGVYRVVAYAGAVNILTWIPVVGFIAGLYGLYLQIVGIEQVHKITAGQAVVTVLITFAVYLIMALVVGGVFFGIHF